MVDQINPNIVAGIGQQVNPLEQMSRFAYMQNALNQNALFQQTYRARQAMGPLAQQAVDPQSGQMDWNKFATLVSTHPDTAFMAPEVLNNIAQKKLVDAETQNQQLTAKASRMRLVSQQAAAALPDYDGSAGHDLTAFISNAASVGAVTPEELPKQIPLLASMQGKSVAEQKQYLAQLARTSAEGAQRLEQINGQYDPELAHDANGNPIPGWRSGIGGIHMAQFGAPPMPGGAAAPGAPAAAPGAPAAAAAPAAPTTPGGVPITLGAVGPAQKGRLATLPDYQKGINDEATFAYKSEQLVNELQNAIKGVKMGAGTSAYVEAAKLAQTFGVDNKYVDEVARGSLGNLQEAKKLMLRLATGDLRTALLPGAGRLTNTEFTAYQDANPNWDTDPRAIDKLLQFTHKMNGLAIRKSQAYALASSAASRGEAVPNLPDITQFEPYWLGKLQKAGLIRPETFDALSGQGGQ